MLAALHLQSASTTAERQLTAHLFISHTLEVIQLPLSLTELHEETVLET